MRIGNYYFEFYNVRRRRPVVYGIDHLACGERPLRPFARADVQSILMMITNRMRNIEWHAKIDYMKVEDMFRFLTDNRLRLMTDFFYEGYVAIDVERVCFVEDVERDFTRLRDRSNVVVVLDEVYKSTGKTRAEVLRPHIDMLDTVNDSDLNLILNYGAMGIVSPENSTRTDGYLDDEEMEKIQSDYRDKYGVRFGKWALLITRNPVKFQKIDLSIKDLELNEKRKSAIAEILQYMSVPKELHAMFESAKYANRNEAELDMYGNTVSAWAEVFMMIVRKWYAKLRRTTSEVNYMPNEFWFDIVNVPALQEAQYTERLKAREELQMWMEMKTVMPEKIDYINERIEHLIDQI